MAIALRRLRDRIRGRLRDTDAQAPTFVPVEYDQAISDAYLELQSRLPAARLYTASGLTIGAGGDTFTLPATVAQYTGGDGGAEYRGDVRIRLQSTGRFLTKSTTDEIDAFRDLSPTVYLSVPEHYALWEEKDQTVRGRVYPGARVAEICDLFVTLEADDLRDFIGSGADDMDDVEILFSRTAATALIYYAAADLLTRMAPEEQQKRRINPQVVPLWLKAADTLLYREAGRRHDLEDTGRVQRWVP